MDDWEVGDPGCSTTRQGDPCTSAFEWRYRLAGEINRLFPAPARNIRFQFDGIPYSDVIERNADCE